MFEIVFFLFLLLRVCLMSHVQVVCRTGALLDVGPDLALELLELGSTSPCPPTRSLAVPGTIRLAACNQNKVCMHGVNFRKIIVPVVEII
jgi:hypothetical protein